MPKIKKLSIFEWFHQETRIAHDKLTLQNSFANWAFENGIEPVAVLSNDIWTALWAHYIQKVEFNYLLTENQKVGR